MNIAERVARAEQSVQDLAREFAVDDLQQLRQSVVV